MPRPHFRGRSRSLAALLAGAVGLAGLTGYSMLPPLLGDDSSESGTSGSTAEATADPKSEEAFFDNLVVLRQMSYQSDAVPASWKTPPEGTWSEVPESTRETYLGFGYDVCNSGFDDSGAVAPDNTDLYTTWLSAKFLCPEHGAEAEQAFLDAYSAETLKAMEYSMLRDSAPASDVLSALTLCEASLELSWELPEGMDRGYFCWIMRANVLAGSEDEQEFISMFQGTEDESPEFDELAEALGATPGGISGLLGVE